MVSLLSFRRFATPVAWACLLFVGNAEAQTISIDRTATYQTMNGFELLDEAMQSPNPSLPGYSAAFGNYIDPLLENLVTDLGFNRIRLEIKSGLENTDDNWTKYMAGQLSYSSSSPPWGWRQLRYATVNDNNDPFSLNMSGFHFRELDNTVQKIIVPWLEKLSENNIKPYVSLCFVSFTKQIPSGSGLQFIHDDPEEYAELILATFIHLRDTYGFVPAAVEVSLEPDNVPEFGNGTFLGDAVVATARRLQGNGFAVPEFILPSVTSMNNAVSYFNNAMSVPGVSQLVNEFSYHRYAGTGLGTSAQVASIAQSLGMRTSMLEWWSGNNSYHTLHRDLKLGQNASWQQGAMGETMNSVAHTTLYAIDDTDPSNPIIFPTSMTKFTRQYYKFIRPGAVRIGASGGGALDPLAFVNPDGGDVVVVKSTSATSQNFTVTGLKAWEYRIKYTTASQYDVDLPSVTIGQGQSLSTSIPGPGVITIYADPSLSYYGKATSSSSHLPKIRALNSEYPNLGNQSFGLELHDAPANASGFILLGLAPANTSIFGVTLLNDGAAYSGPIITDHQGRATLPLSIPNIAGLAGFHLYAQFVVVGSNGLVATKGLRVRIAAP